MENGVWIPVEKLAGRMDSMISATSRSPFSFIPKRHERRLEKEKQNADGGNVTQWAKTIRNHDTDEEKARSGQMNGLRFGHRSE